MDALGYPQIMSRLINVPLWVHPTTAAVVYNVLAGRLGHAAMAVPQAPIPQANRFVGDPPPNADGKKDEWGYPVREPFRLTRAGVGVITVTGELVSRGAWIGASSGMTSYEGITHQVQRAGADARVKSVILDIHSPGGNVIGASETAAAVRAVAATKPVVAVANGMAASAAYLISSSAKAVIVTPSGIAGSIGVVCLHMDFSRYLDKEGVTPTLIFEGDRKMDGNPLEPLSDVAHASLRADVKRYYELFIETVVAGRGRKTPASAARETRGRTYIGREAVTARLVDDVGTFDEVLDELSRRASRQSPSPGGRTTARSAAMDLSEHTQANGGGAAAGGGSEPVTQGVTLLQGEPLQPMLSMPQTAYDAALATARREGEAAQVARFNALRADPRIKGREAFAMQFACVAPGMPAEEVGALCENVPAASTGRAAPLSIEDRARETGADAVGSQPAPAGDAAAAGWTEAVAMANKTVSAQMSARIRRR